jgi:hypothetical protein
MRAIVIKESNEDPILKDVTDCSLSAFLEGWPSRVTTITAWTIHDVHVFLHGAFGVDSVRWCCKREQCRGDHKQMFHCPWSLVRGRGGALVLKRPPVFL